MRVGGLMEGDLLATAAECLAFSSYKWPFHTATVYIVRRSRRSLLAKSSFFSVSPAMLTYVCV